MTREQGMRFRLGVFVLGAMFLLATLILLLGEIPDWFKGQVRYTVRLQTAPGLEQGSPVRMSGVRIGEVQSFALDPNTGEVSVNIVVDRKYQLRQSDRASISQGLVLGDTAISFSPQREGNRELAPNGFVFQGIQEDIGTALRGAKDLLPTAQVALEELRLAAKNFNELAPDLRRTNSELQVTLNNIGQAAENVNNLLRGNSERITGAIDNVSRVAQRLDDTLSPENQRNLSAIIKNFRAASDQMAIIFTDANRERFNSLLENLRNGAEKVAGFLTDENRENTTVTLRNLRESSERMSAVLSPDNQRLATETLKNVKASSEQLAAVFSPENQQNVNAVLKNLKAGSDQFEGLVRNVNDTTTEARSLVKNLNAKTDSIGGQVDDGVRELRATLQKFDSTVTKADEALVGFRDVGKLLADRGPIILKNVEDSSARLSQMAVQVGEFTKTLSASDGTVRRLFNDADLYNNLNASARGAAAAIGRFDRIVRDLEIFADKVARHPEVLGIRGTVVPGSGIK